MKVGDLTVLTSPVKGLLARITEVSGNWIRVDKDEFSRWIPYSNGPFRGLKE